MSIGLTISKGQGKETSARGRHPRPSCGVIGSDLWKWTSSNSTDFVAVTKRPS